MAIGIYRKNTLKRRRWYNKPAYQGIQILYRRLLDNLSVFTSEQVKAALSGKESVYTSKVQKGTKRQN
jgi:hypothetical protein